MKRVISKIAKLSEVPILKYLILLDSIFALIVSPVFLYAVGIILCFATDSPQANNMPTYIFLFLIFCLFLLYFWAKFVVLVVLTKRIFTKNTKPAFERSFGLMFAYDVIFSIGLYILLFFFFNSK